jgi:hypothetical protein
MSEPVKPRRIAIGAGVLVALYVVTSFLAREVPDSLIAVLGGPDTRVDRIGGLRVHYKPLGGEVRVVDVPGIAEDQIAEVIDVLVGGGLSMREALESDFAIRLGVPAAPERGHDRDPSAVVVEFDQWLPEDGSALHTVPYLLGPSREAIEREVADRIAAGGSLPEGSILGYERIDPLTSSSEQRTYWRAYELSDEVSIDGSMVASAIQTFDPNTERAIVLLDFTPEGAERFCEVTRRMVGRKLATILGDRVRSAPIISGPVCGGRASITMGGSDPVHQQEEAQALIAVLSQGAQPIGGTIESQQFLPAANVRAYEWTARLGLGLLAGLAAGLLTFLAIALARPRWRTPLEPAPGERPFPWRRLAVTLIAPLALIVGGTIDLPGVNGVEIAHIMRGAATDQFSVIALGVMPIITSFLLVEVVALAVPRWRWRRHDARGRIALGKAVAVVSIVIALVQAYFVVTYLESLGRGGAAILTNPGWSTRIVITCSLATGTVLLGVVAGLIREHGLGNGYGALLASGSVLVLLQPIFRDPEIATTVGLPDLSSMVTAVVIAAATACVLRWRIAGEPREPELRVPISGISPVSDAGGLVTVIAGLSALGLGVALWDAIDWVMALRARTWLMLGILAVSVPVYAWLFGRPAVVERVAMQAGLDRPSQRTWLRATAVSAWLIIGVAVIARFAVVRDGLQQSLTDAIGIMVFTAVVLDIVQDARARRRALVPAGVLHQIQYAGVVERVLADAGIPCHIHASALRTLLVFFGPFAPAIVMVPEEHAAAARSKVDDVLRAATSKPPVALLQEPPTRRLTWDAQTTAGR